jgi:hypothetical protein
VSCADEASGTEEGVGVGAALLCAMPDDKVADGGVEEGADGVADKVGEVGLIRHAWEGGLARVCALLPDGEKSCLVGVPAG